MLTQHTADLRRRAPSFLARQFPGPRPSLAPVVAILVAIDVFAIAMWVVR